MAYPTFSDLASQKTQNTMVESRLENPAFQEAQAYPHLRFINEDTDPEKSNVFPEATQPVEQG